MTPPDVPQGAHPAGGDNFFLVQGNLKLTCLVKNNHLTYDL